MEIGDGGMSETKDQMIARRKRTAKIQKGRMQRMKFYGQTKIDIELGLTAIMMHKGEDQIVDTKDIAEICGCSRSTINNIERNAIRKLRVHKHLAEL